MRRVKLARALRAIKRFSLLISDNDCDGNAVLGTLFDNNTVFTKTVVTFSSGEEENCSDEDDLLLSDFEDEEGLLLEQLENEFKAQSTQSGGSERCGGYFGWCFSPFL